MTEIDEAEKGDGGQSLAVPVPTCWAYSKQRLRCGMPAGHLGDHGVLYSWTDGECYDPTADLVAPPMPSRVVTMNLSPAEQSLADEQAMLDDLGAVPNGECFTCGCLEDAHPCVAHGCRSFVP